MAATETVKTLAASFEGLGGATALSVIAFSIVFLVLAGLTLVIYAMRYVTKFASKAPANGSVSSASSAAVHAQPSKSAASADDGELVAVIAAAIAAQTGTMMSIKSIVPAGTHLIGEGTDAWIACGRMEALQSALTDRWN
jgi:sodium pump decarboxylase gamma subunit